MNSKQSRFIFTTTRIWRVGEMRFLVVSLALVSVLAGSARAETLDLTDDDQLGTLSGTINDAIFEFETNRGGTGNFNPFVQMQGSGQSVSEQGYNTSGRPVPFDEKTALNFMHNVQLFEIPIVTRGVLQYFEFLLNINENEDKAGNGFLSLDKIQLYTSPVGSQNTTNLASLGTLRYDLDVGADGDSTVLLYSGRAGGGLALSDLVVLIPVANFVGVSHTDFLYFYSQFGATPDEPSNPSTTYGTNGRLWSVSDGVEGWAVETFDDSLFFTPEPDSIIITAMCFVALLYCTWRRIKVGVG